MHEATRLIRDSAERYKLKVSLPGGRYQLSLDDRAVNVLVDDLGLSTRETVPDPFVPFFVAMGDAWFPRERDVDSVLQDLSTDGSLTPREQSVLVSYVTGSWIPERNEERIRNVINDSPIAGEIESTDLKIKGLPEIPDVLKPDDGDTDTETNDGQTPTREPTQEPQAPEPEPDTEAIESLQEIPGIGPHRAENLVDGGVQSLEMLAEARPIDLAGLTGINEGIAAVAVEGARELLGQTDPASERLAQQTGVPADIYQPALSSLAASGIPASEAIPTLRVAYGPTVADIPAVSRQQAYFLWEAGYQTPHEILEASIDELTDVYQIGATTAADIQESVQQLIEQRRQ